jgi:hypothetical protein
MKPLDLPMNKTVMFELCLIPDDKNKDANDISISFYMIPCQQ